MVWLAGLGAGGCAGGEDASARLLIEPATMLGKVALAITGTGKQLVERGQISQHRRVMGLGVEIDVWVIKARPAKNGEQADEPKGTVVLIHPLMNGKYWFLPLGRLLARRGWDVVLPDLRAHGRSGGTYITWGAKEKHDIDMVMDDLIGDGSVSDRIYVLGASLGGLVAVQYAALDRRVRGVMALAPPASMRRIARRILPLETPSSFEQSLLEAGAIAGFYPDGASAVDAARQLTCPIILAHGWLDPIVPYGHSRAIYRAAREPKKLIPLPLSGHDAGLGMELWLAARIEELAKMDETGDSPARDRAEPDDLDEVDEKELIEQIRKLEAIQKSLR
jgi:pimeloyl-ACP methyl ester carboxylesterase